MLNYIEYLGLPSKIAIGIVVTLLAINLVGELLEFKGKVVPEWVKVRKFFIRKKKEREILNKLPTMMENMMKKFDEFTSHYDSDNIHKRDEWIAKVNNHLEDSDCKFKNIHKELKENSENTLNLLIDSKRKTIIDFASRVIDESAPVTREQFNRIFKLHKEYEDLIKKNGLTNGEIDISYQIITESYEKHMKNHSFIEDIRGYKNNI